MAAALAWALERAVAGAWGRSGRRWARSGEQAGSPPSCSPPAFLVASRRARLVLGAAVTAGLAIVAFVGHVDNIYRDVITYHRERPVHAESLWASLAFLSRTGSGGPRRASSSLTAPST